MPTVNSQITDAVTQTNVKVVGEAPAMAMGSLYAPIASVLERAAAAQQAHSALTPEATNSGVIQIYTQSAAAVDSVTPQDTAAEEAKP